VTIVRLSRVTIVALCFTVSDVVAGGSTAQDVIQFDSVTGNYAITYCCDESGEMATSVFEPRTKISPRIASVLKEVDGGAVQYRYDISISLTSVRALNMFILDPITSLRSRLPLDFGNPSLSSEQERVVELNAELALQTPVGWKGFVNGSSRRGPLRMGWRRGRLIDKHVAEFGPGSSQAGFGFNSNDLPAVIAAEFTSKTTLPRSYAGEGPARNSPVMPALIELEREDFVPRHVAAPGIRLVTPYSCSGTLQSVIEEVQGWPSRNLMEPMLTAEVVALLDTASSNCATSAQTARAALDQLLGLISQRFPGIDSDTVATMMAQNLADHDYRLAARVVMFDVRYVLSRI
jgi:hypothetical protein